MRSSQKKRDVRGGLCLVPGARFKVNGRPEAKDVLAWMLPRLRCRRDPLETSSTYLFWHAWNSCQAARAGVYTVFPRAPGSANPRWGWESADASQAVKLAPASPTNEDTGRDDPWNLRMTQGGNPGSSHGLPKKKDEMAFVEVVINLLFLERNDENRFVEEEVPCWQ